MGKGALIGLLAGTFLGLVLKAFQFMTDIGVYTLLLNVDFLPFFGSILWPEWMEFLFHLIIAVFIGMLYGWVLDRWNLDKTWRWWFSYILTVPTIFLYFPLSYLALKEVPPMDDMAAIALWTIGHLAFGASMPMLYEMFTKKRRQSII
ncbi:hypothetical protein [Rossellomorea marisflavi]|uniref:hypothetical protein n=1 Tax=Rossellomorea marisflavi TaxID=189381 RepID=UPI00204254DA|nr:hypothetical protein [Rossellomorea marisflavi]MCM2590363.1 hypothetical protein [Rossellomorea marisflavi]